MGITTNDFFENIYSALFSPKAFFERQDANISVRVAFATIVFISIIYKTAEGIFNKSILNVSFLGSLLFNRNNINVVFNGSIF